MVGRRTALRDDSRDREWAGAHAAESRGYGAGGDTDHALAVLAGIRADSRAESLVDDSSLADAYVDTTGLVGHRQVTDWHLLNLAARHDGMLVTFDHRIARAVLPGDADRVVTLG